MTDATDKTPAVKTRKPWRAARKPARALGQGIINLALTLLTIHDIRQRSDDEIKGDRKVWMIAAFAPPIGPIAYFVFGRKRSAEKREQ